MNKMHSILGLCLALGALSTSAWADGAGTWRVRLGGLNLNPDVDSDRFVGVEAAVNNAGLGPSEAQADVDSDWTLGLTIAYDITDNIAVELLGVWPLEHDLRASGNLDETLAGVGLNDLLGDTDLLPPTLTAQYRFLKPESRFRPYVGAGVTYTLFFDDGADNNLDTALQALGVAQPGDNVDLDIESGFHFAVQAGVDIRIKDNWLFNLGYWRVFAEKDVDIEVNDVVIDSAEVTISPNVFSVGIGYEF